MVLTVWTRSGPFSKKISRGRSLIVFCSKMVARRGARAKDVEPFWRPRPTPKRSKIEVENQHGKKRSLGASRGRFWIILSSMLGSSGCLGMCPGLPWGALGPLGRQDDPKGMPGSQKLVRWTPASQNVVILGLIFGINFGFHFWDNLLIFLGILF